MSKIQPGSPSPAPSTSVGNQGAIASGTGGALGLGIDVGLLAEIPIGEAYRPAAEKPVDRVDDQPKAEADSGRGARPKDAPVEKKDLRAAASPFRELPRAEPRMAQRVLAASVPVETEIDLSFETLGKLAKIEAKLGADHAGAFDKIRPGTLLVTHDGQAVRAGRTPLSDRALRDLATKLTRDANNQAALKDHIKQFAKLQARFLAGTKMDIQALIQRVLRECYHIQNGLLQDKAEKVQFENAKKKKLREQGQKARDTLMKWRTLESNEVEGGFIAEEPFECWELGDDGELYRPTMDESDVEAWHAAVDAALEARGDDVGSALSSYEDFFYGESNLTREDEALLDQALEGRSADWLEENIGEIVVAVGNMNKSDFDAYFIEGEPGQNLFENIRTQDMEPYVELLESLGPAQMLYLFSASAAGSGFDLNASTESIVSRAAVAGVVGGVAGGFMAGAAAAGVAGPPGALFGGIIGAMVAGAGAGTVGAALILAEGHVFSALNGDQHSDLETAMTLVIERVAEETGTSITVGESITLENTLDALAALEGAHDGGEVDGAFGTPPKVGGPKTFNVPDQLDNYVEDLETEIQQIGDDAQIANVRMQNELDRQQQTLQMMTNIAKMLHDTAMAAVRKLSQ